MGPGLGLYQGCAIWRKLTWFGYAVVTAVVGIISLGGVTSAAAPVSGAATISIGRSLDSVEPATSVVLEPSLNYELNPIQKIEFATAIERPTDPYLNFSVPKSSLIYSQKLLLFNSAETSIRIGLSALDLERWQSDGYMIRPSISFQLVKPLRENLSLLLRAGTYGQLNEYTQRTNGADLPKFGFSQRVGISWNLAPVTLEARLNVEQKNVGVWKNDYTTYEQISYAIADSISVGVSHEILSSVIDGSTGLGRPFRFFDSRESRVSFLVDFNWL